MRRGARPLAVDPALRLLVRQGLLEGDVLAVVPHGWGGRRDWLAQVLTVDEAGLEIVEGTFRTAVDLTGADGLRGPDRVARARRLAQLVEPGGFLHVAWRSRRPDAGRAGGPTVPADDLAASFRRGWTLLGVHDLWDADRHAWFASFLRVPTIRRERPVVRNFTDLGAFGSLDLGTAPDRPPWGK